MSNLNEDILLFTEKNEILGSRYEEVESMEFYNELYGGQEGWLEKKGCDGDRKPNAIFSTAYSKTPEQIKEIEKKEVEEAEEDAAIVAAGGKPPFRKKRKRIWVKNTIVFEGMEGLQEVIDDDNPLLLWTVASPVAFSGKNRTYDNAYHLWGFVIDLDGVGIGELEDLLHQIDNDVIPKPTYLVNSGHGLHVYFCFEEPVPMYPHLREPLKALKKELTKVVWNKYTSTIPAEERQYQGLVQGYRAVGSRTKLGPEHKVTAFRVSPPTTLASLKSWAEDERAIDFDEFKHTTLDEAHEKWPEWYEARIVRGDKRKPFDFPREVYDAWLKRMELGTFDGNRYNCVAVLFSLANRCEGVDFEEAMQDAMERVPRLNRLTKKKGNEFTEDDVLDAAGYYSDEFRNLGLDAVYSMTKIYIKPNKRNGRSQSQHLKLARFARDLNHDDDKAWINKDGRPEGSGTMEERVVSYAAAQPDASVTEIARALGVSRTTVYKWLRK